MKLADLKLYDGNPRIISEDALDSLCRSIKRDPEFMKLRPIVFDPDDNNKILGGNQRYKACVRLGMSEVPDEWVRSAAGLTAEQKRRFVLVDNAPEGMAGHWNIQSLTTDWIDMDLPSLGFDQSILTAPQIELPKEIEVEEDESQLDRAEELLAKWQVKPGDLWQVGKHLLLCGDSTKQVDVSRLLGDAKPLLMVTDPPYGVNYDAGWRDEAAKNCPSMGKRKDTAKGKVSNDDNSDWTEAWKLFPGDIVYVWHGCLQSWIVAESLLASKFDIRAEIVWAKQHLVISQGAYHFKHEPCWYGVKKGATAKWIGDRKQTTLWEIDKPQKSDTGHSTQKPIECMARPMRHHDAHEVYDPFLGSGTTMVAAESIGRVCYGVEIDTKHVAVSLQRMQDAFPGIVIQKKL